MGWMQQAPEQITYTDVEVVLPPPVKKQVWDGEQFVPMTLYRKKGIPSSNQLQWLKETVSWPGTYKNGQYWQYSIAGDFTVMDEQLYTWYQLKWGGK